MKKNATIILRIEEEYKNKLLDLANGNEETMGEVVRKILKAHFEK